METQKKNHQEVIDRAIRRSQECEDFWSPLYMQALDDLRFSAGEHWTAAERNARENGPNKRPCLTVDKLEQYIRQVANDMRKNKPAIKVRPVDSEEDPESAKIMSGLIRQIEYASRADQAYNEAGNYQLRAGIAWLEVATDYADDETFDQEAQVKLVADPFSAMIDPLAVVSGYPDGSSARFGFLFEDMPKADFEADYPGISPSDWNLAQYDNADKWLTEDTVRVAKYWEVVTEQKEIKSADGQKTRKSQVKKCMVYKLCGGAVLEESEFPSKYIGLIPVFGRLLNLNGEVVIRSLIRSARDAQKLYDYAASEIMGRVFMAPRDKIAVAIESLEGHEDAWSNSHKSDDPTLPYNHKDADGQPLPVPQVLQAGAVPVALQNLLNLYEHDIQGALGMYNASLGAQSNEKSGRAILARQAEADTSTFDFIDNLARAIQQVGRILVEIVPRIYDTTRIIRILGVDDSEDTVEISPDQEKSLTVLKNTDTGHIKKLFNPGYAKWDCAVTVGPSYSTQRQEAAEFMTQAVQSSPQLMQVAGDLWMKSLDMPMAEEIGERLKKTMPPELVNDDDDKPMQLPPELMAQIEQMAMQMNELAKQNAELQQRADDNDIKRAQLALDAQDSETKRYQAETDRAAKLAPAFGPAEIQALVVQMLQDILTSSAPALPTATPEQPTGEPFPDLQVAPEMMGVTPPEADLYGQEPVNGV